MILPTNMISEGNYLRYLQQRANRPIIPGAGVHVGLQRELEEYSFHINRFLPRNQIVGKRYICGICFANGFCFRSDGRVDVRVCIGTGMGECYHGWAYTRNMIFDPGAGYRFQSRLVYPGRQLNLFNLIEATTTFRNIVRELQTLRKLSRHPKGT